MTAKSAFRAMAALAVLGPLSANAPTVELELTVERVRSEEGVLHLCLTQDKRHFPDCSGDSRAIHRSVPATAGSMTIEGLAPGSYAVSILHDENANGRMDSFLGVPREGFGFSGKSAPRFGPPSFKEARIELNAGSARQVVRMRYVL